MLAWLCCDFWSLMRGYIFKRDRVFSTIQWERAIGNHQFANQLKRLKNGCEGLKTPYSWEPPLFYHFFKVPVHIFSSYVQFFRDTSCPGFLLHPLEVTFVYCMSSRFIISGKQPLHFKVRMIRMFLTEMRQPQWRMPLTNATSGECIQNSRQDVFRKKWHVCLPYFILGTRSL